MANSKAVFFLGALCFTCLVLGKTDVSRPDKRVAPNLGAPKVHACPPGRLAPVVGQDSKELFTQTAGPAETCKDCVGSLTVYPLEDVMKGK